MVCLGTIGAGKEGLVLPRGTKTLKRLAYLVLGCACASASLFCVLFTAFVLSPISDYGEPVRVGFGGLPWGMAGVCVSAAVLFFSLACMCVRALRAIDVETGTWPIRSRLLIYACCLGGAVLILVCLALASGGGP